jgi:simple sugar transport system ATP-binding protein
VRAISDRVSVLRKGALVGTAAGATDERELARMMVGRPMTDVARRGDAPIDVDRPLLRVRDLRVTGAGVDALRSVSFDIAPGEILGVAGVSGNGQTELVDVLAGMRRPEAGSIRVGDTELAGAQPSQVIAAGVGRIPEDRHASLVPDLSVAVNLVLERIADFGGWARLDERRIRAHAAGLIERYAIRARPDDRLATLSGGNVQKVLLARVLSRDPRVVVVSQPTRGLDVGATEYVRSELLARRQAGSAVLLVSEDLDELLALSDRVIVLYEGQLVGEMRAEEADPERLGMLMAGRAADGDGRAA